LKRSNPRSGRADPARGSLECSRGSSRHDAALGTLDLALAVAADTDQHGYDAVLYRQQGDVVLAAKPGREGDAEALFERALEIARSQQARGFELRAATSLARLWRDQGRHEEARALLEPVYAWFSEGFDTSDLIEAKALLHELY
jgi:predicted ATPase